MIGNFNKSLASFVWIKTILDSDDHHHKDKDKPWEFYRFQLISDLYPLFFENYEFSPLFLSVVRNHPDSASILFDKGIHYFPNKTNLNLFAAYHFLSERNDKDKAYKILNRIMEENKNLNSMATSIYYSLKSKKMSKKFLSREILNRVKDPILRKFILKKINQ